ncbi:RNA-protein complex protein Nop10 [Candidatus Woesearchaeota archaeon]|nr:RNA-protein complex protein Nop10 [Candidatus Woesearchaeota archaeon]
MYKCSKHGYCLEKVCPKCGNSAEAVSIKYSPEDKYGEYRRKVKWEKIGK